jgi:hypothetical protein
VALADKLSCLGSETSQRKIKGEVMKYIVSWKIPKGSVVDAEARFLKTGAPPPAGVKMIGRWHGMSGGGVLIAETDDAKALFSWVSYWNDLLEFQTTACVEDAEAGEVMASLKR